MDKLSTVVNVNGQRVLVEKEMQNVTMADVMQLAFQAQAISTPPKPDIGKSLLIGAGVVAGVLAVQCQVPYHLQLI